MDNLKEINSYNSLTMSPNIKKEIRASTSYITTKINIENELNDTIKKNEINSYKKEDLESNNNNNPQKNSITIDKAFINSQNISTKEEDSSSTTFTKLPKIQKHLTSAILSGIKNTNSNSLLIKDNDSSNSNIIQKDYSSLNNDDNIMNNNNLAYRIFNNQKNKNRSMSSTNSIYSHLYKYRDYNSFISPPDPLLKRTVVPKVNPRFGKMKEYITLPEFRGEEPITKFEYKPILKEMLTSPSIEKQYEVNLYINSTKMLNNLIYLKTQLNKDGLITLENLINVKKLNKYYKNETEEEDEIIRIEPEQNNFNNNFLDNINSRNINNFIGNNKTQENNSNNNIETNKKTENGISRNNIIISNNNSISNNSQFRKNSKIQRPQTVYHELKPYYTLKNKNDNTLIFESRFESGNLLCAFRTEDENSYQLYLQNDTNTTGYIQWFFFRVSNTKKGRKVNFNIINMLRKTCIYNHGFKIMTYSKMASIKENLGWHRDCYNSIYYPNNLYVYNNNNASKKRNLHSLSFDYEFKYDNDTVYFANCLPYFYSSLMKELNKYELDEEKYPFFHRKTLAVTLGGNDLDMFTINSMYDILKNGITSVITTKSDNYSIIKKNYDKNNSSKIIDERKAVIIIGRQHPGETVGSYVVKGCIDFLMGNSEEAKKMREIYLFKIIPMMNPDGVLVGNSRTSFAGCDLNRRWGKPNEIIHPEVYNTKQMILKLSAQRNIAFIIDCHGHFGTFNSLFYCNYKDNKRSCKLFPYICSKLSKIISFQQCTFSMPKYKLSTERISLFNELNDEDNDNIVALETSFFGINRSGEYARNYFNSSLLKEVGRDVCMGMLSYYYKYENVSLENYLFSNKENVKKLDVDMREFENEIINEVNEDDEENNENDEKSESEPSVDNLDKNQIMKLMPNNGKKRKRRKNKYKKFDKKKDNKNRDIDIELYNPLKEAAKKLEEEKRKKNKIIINCNNNDKIKKIIKQQIAPTEPNTKNEYTQTEEIFFKMPWTYFKEQYKIMSCNRRWPLVNRNNFFGISSNIIKNNNFYKRHMNINNLNSLNKYNGNLNHNIRSRSLNNKIILNNKRNDIPFPNKNYYNLNINNKINNINNNNKDNNINIKNEKNNILGVNNDKTMKVISKQNSIKKDNIQNNKQLNLNEKKEIKKSFIYNELIKTNSFIPKPIMGIKNKSKSIINNNINNNHINSNIQNVKENEIIKNENTTKFLSTKFAVNNKIKKDNLKIKMSKSSSSFYN